jgi:hypothetical protein
MTNDEEEDGDGEEEEEEEKEKKKKTFLLWLSSFLLVVCCSFIITVSIRSTGCIKKTRRLSMLFNPYVQNVTPHSETRPAKCIIGQTVHPLLLAVANALVGGHRIGFTARMA